MSVAVAPTELGETEVVATPPMPITFEQYLATDSDEGPLREWVQGKVITHAMPTRIHQELIEFLTALMGQFVRMFDLGRVLSAGYPMRTTLSGNAREPDVLFVAHEHQARAELQYLNGPADLAIEIISPDSPARDRAEKFDEYQEGGVREYWLIDSRPGKYRVDVYVLDEHGKYQVVAPTNGVFHSTVLPGFWLDEAWLWDATTDPSTAMLQIVGLERMMTALRKKAENLK